MISSAVVVHDHHLFLPMLAIQLLDHPPLLLKV
jgi:hypothetical protein